MTASDTFNLNQTTLSILALYRSDYLHSFYSRDIAPDLDVAHTTAAAQLKRLEEANILHSKKKGNLKEYSLNLQNQLTKYYLILAETYTTLTFLDRNFLVKRVLEELTGFARPTEAIDCLLPGVVILFGSFASGSEGPSSDVDLLTISDSYGNVPAKSAEFGLPVEGALRNIELIIGREINVKSMTPRQFKSGLTQASPFERQVVANHIVLQNIDNFCDLLWRFFKT
jgi:DNA-binding MarR family transcriptional regulator